MIQLLRNPEFIHFKINIPHFNWASYRKDDILWIIINSLTGIHSPLPINDNEPTPPRTKGHIMNSNLTQNHKPIITGIIAEYNPFHNGHAYHIEQARRLTHADYIIVIMSGNFVQRGTPAIIDKYYRTRMALQNGADAVFELPVCYATGSAEYFAEGAIALLTALGADCVCFGSECGDISMIKQAASILLDEPVTFQQALKESLKNGLSFPQAREMALSAYLQQTGSSEAQTANLLSQPNNILGIEYCKAIKKQNSHVVPYTITRQGHGYHDEEISNCLTASASGIRKLIFNGEHKELICEQMPASAFSLLEEAYHKQYPVQTDDFSAMLGYRLLLQRDNGFVQFQDCSPELENRIRNHLPDYCSFSQFADCLHTKETTHARINRCLLHILLDMNTHTVEDYRANGYVYYARLLGFCKNSTSLLTELNQRTTIPVLSSLSKAEQRLCSRGNTMLKQDFLAANIYELAIHNRYHTDTVGEYRKLIIETP